MPRQGIPIGRLFGISLRLHPSWFIIFVLVTWALAASYFPTTYPAWSLAEKISAGILTSLLFFTSVLAHELMHSLVAQREGINVRSITLFIFGGVSEISGEPKKASDEFFMALAGPMTSLVLGGAFLGIWFGLRGLSGAGQFISAVAYWLGIINISLGIFNLVPGFPLDGGRVLRSILWQRSGNLRSSTKTASNIGRAVAYIFIFAGIFLVFTGNWFNGLWLAFIGWFLDNAAVGSYRQLALNDMLQGHKVSELMSQDCVTVASDANAEHLVDQYVLTSGVQCFPVIDNGKLRGVVNMANLRNVPRKIWSGKTAGELMTPMESVRGARPDEDLTQVLKIMTEDNVGQVPVFQDNKVIGMVSRDRLLSFIDLRAGLGM